MARRRVNKKVVIILGAIVGLLAVGVVARKTLPEYFPRLKWIFRGSPAQHFAQAKALADQGKYEEAIEQYKRAIQLTGRAGEPQAYVALGDCYANIALDDTENLQRAKFYWDQAILSDTHYVPALERELDLYSDYSEVNRGAEQLSAVQEAAQRLLDAEPGNRKASLALNRAIVKRAMTGIQVDAKPLGDAVAALQKLATGPDLMPDALSETWQYQLYRAQQAANQSDKQGAADLFAEVMKSIDQALADHPDNARVHFLASRAIAAVGQLDRDQGQPPKYTDRVRDENVKAGELVKPVDEDYSEIRLNEGKQFETRGEIAQAEKIYHEVIEQRPSDLLARLVLSEMVGRDPSRRKEAIDLLEKGAPIPAADSFGAKSFNIKRLKLTALANATNLRLDQITSPFEAVTDDAERNQLLKQVESDYARVRSESSESTTSLQILGRLQMAKGDYVNSVGTLEHALQIAGQPRTLADYEALIKLKYMVARANIQVEQTARAESLLKEIVVAYATFNPARLALAQLLYRKGAVEECRQQLEILLKATPDSPVVNHLYILTLDPKDPAQKTRMTAMYAKLPEAAPRQAMDKVQIAIFMDDKAEAARLLDIAEMGSPDLNTQVSIASMYAKIGMKDKALALIDSLIAKNPTVDALRLLRPEIEGTQVEQLRREYVEKIPDPFAREMGLYQLDSQEGKNDSAFEHLNAAWKLKPEDGRANALMFQYAVNAGDLTKAATYLEAIKKSNYDSAGGQLFAIQFELLRAQQTNSPEALTSAAEKANQLTKSRPEFAQVWVVLAKVQIAQQKYTEALRSYEDALARQAQNMDALIGRINCSYLLQQPQDAKRYIEMARKVFPKDAQLREIYVQHEMKYGDPEKAIIPREEDWKNAIAEKAPTELGTWLRLNDTYLAVAKAKGAPDAAAAKPFLLKARDLMAKAQEKWPDEIAVTARSSEVLVQLKDNAAAEKAIQALRDRPEWQGRQEPVALLADYYDRVGKAADAQKVLSDYFATSPKALVVQVKLSTVLAKQGKFDDAMKVLDSNLEEPGIRKQRIELLMDAKRFDDAEKEIKQILAVAPPGPVILSHLAFIYNQTGRKNEALQVLNQALALDPRAPDALLMRATMFVDAGVELDRVIQDMQTLHDLPDKPGEQLNIATDARMLLARAYVLRADDSAAINELEPALRAVPENIALRILLVRLYAAARPPRWAAADRLFAEAHELAALKNNTPLMNEEALVWLKRKDPQQATKVIIRALELERGNMDYFRTYLQALLEARAYQQLITVTDDVKAEHRTAWIYEFRGRAKRRLEDRDGALAEMTAGIQVAVAQKDDAAIAQLVNTIKDEIGITAAIRRIAPLAEGDDPRWKLMMAYLLQANGNLADAVQWVQRVINQQPPPPTEAMESALGMAGDLYLRQDPPDAKNSVAAYRKLLEMKPSDVASLNNLACTILLPNSGATPADALQYSRRAMDIVGQGGVQWDGIKPFILDTHGWVLVKAGRVDEGRSYIRQAIDGKSDFAEAYYHLGEALLAQSKPDVPEAQKALNQALALVQQVVSDQSLDASLKTKIEDALARSNKQQP